MVYSHDDLKEVEKNCLRNTKQYGKAFADNINDINQSLNSNDIISAKSTLLNIMAGSGRFGCVLTGYMNPLLKVINEGLDNKLQKSDKLVETLKSEKTTLSKQTDECQTAKEKLNNDKSELTNKIGTLDQKNSDLTKQNEGLHDKLQKSDKSVATLKSEKTALSKEADELNAEKNQCLEAKSDLLYQVKVLKIGNKELESQNQSLEKAVKTTNENVEKCSKNLTESHDRIDGFLQTIKDLNQENSQCQTIKKDNTELTQHNKALCGELNRSYSKFELGEHPCVTKASKASFDIVKHTDKPTLDNAIESLMQKNKELSSKIDELNKEKAQLSDSFEKSIKQNDDPNILSHSDNYLHDGYLI